MSAYTFFFNRETFDQRQTASPDAANLIDYVTGDDKRPLNAMIDGDELFIVGLLDSQVRIAGRLVVDGKPMNRAEAEMRLGRKNLLDKKIYLVGKPGLIDRFRANQTLDAEVAKGLELTNVAGEEGKVAGLRAGNPDSNQFRVPLKLSEASADALRRALGLGLPGSKSPMAYVDPVVFESGEGLDQIPPGQDDDEYRLQSIKTRRGQSVFRDRLMMAYGRQCVITRCRVEGLLEAAHITPHSEHTDYDVSNGLLLRSDIHTLFDLNMFGIDADYRT